MLRPSFVIATILLSSSVGISSADAATFIFEQGGYADGATLTGSFTGSDKNGDGFIRRSDHELTAFSISFPGNSQTGPASLGINDFYDIGHVPGLFSYNLDGSFDFDDGDAIQVGGGAGDYVGIAGGIGFADEYCIGTAGCGIVSGGSFGVDSSASAVRVTQVAAAVPELATWGMMVGGMGAVGGSLRYRRRRNVYRVLAS